MASCRRRSANTSSQAQTPSLGRRIQLEIACHCIANDLINSVTSLLAPVAWWHRILARLQLASAPYKIPELPSQEQSFRARIDTRLSTLATPHLRNTTLDRSIVYTFTVLGSARLLPRTPDQGPILHEVSQRARPEQPYNSQSRHSRNRLQTS